MRPGVVTEKTHTATVADPAQCSEINEGLSNTVVLEDHEKPGDKGPRMDFAHRRYRNFSKCRSEVNSPALVRTGF